MSRPRVSARVSRAARRAEIEHRLLTVLQRLLSEDPSFSDLTLARLLQETGLSRTTFYKHFDSKVDVLAAWFDDAMEQLLQASRSDAQMIAAPTREELGRGMARLTDVFRSHLPLITAVYETAAHDAEMRRRLAEARSEAKWRVCRHILRGQAGDWINSDVDAGPMAAWIVALCEGGLRHIVGRPGPPPDSSGGLDAIWFTLYAPAQRPQA